MSFQAIFSFSLVTPFSCNRNQHYQDCSWGVGLRIHPYPRKYDEKMRIWSVINQCFHFTPRKPTMMYSVSPILTPPNEISSYGPGHHFYSQRGRAALTFSWQSWQLLRRVAFRWTRRKRLPNRWCSISSNSTQSFFSSATKLKTTDPPWRLWIPLSRCTTKVTFRPFAASFSTYLSQSVDFNSVNDKLHLVAPSGELYYVSWRHLTLYLFSLYR